MPTSRTWAAPSKRHAVRSTRPTGRRNTELRVRCLRQLRDALREHVEELRELTIAEVGAPTMLTAGAQLEGPIDDLEFCATTAETYNWRTDLGVATPQGIKTTTHHRARSGRCCRRDHPVELSRTRSTSPSSDQRWRQGTPIVLKPAPDTPWCAAAVGQIIAEHTDLPAGRGQHRHLQRPRGRCAAVERPTGGHGFVHRVDGDRPGRDGRRGRDHQEGLPRTGRQVGVPRPRRRGSRRRLLDVGVHRRDARRTGLRDHHPTGGAPRPLRRSGRGRRRHHGIHQARRPDRQAHGVRSVDLGTPARPGAVLPGSRARRGRQVRLWRRPPRPINRRVTSSSPP